MKSAAAPAPSSPCPIWGARRGATPRRGSTRRPASPRRSASRSRTGSISASASPRPATLFGSGQVEQIADAVRQAEAELLIVDAAITPVQQKNLEEGTKAKVIDRTGLILEIFGERAATAEGRLQVELAHLDYQAGRLVRSWTHLERQRGGFGFLGGPGETQIEADRRLIRDRMAKLRSELDQVARTRTLHRVRRQRAPWPVIALVGYTNAGKSTLFNRLTRAEVLAEDLLFATLDPTMREIALPGFDKAILSDTVGFISDLPTQLVAAFRATLEEVVSADLIVHVRDISHPDSDAQREDVEQVLKEIGVEGRRRDRGLEQDRSARRRGGGAGRAPKRRGARTWSSLSALTGEGVDGSARRRVRRGCARTPRCATITLPASDGELIAWLHANGEVLSHDHEGLETALRGAPVRRGLGAVPGAGGRRARRLDQLLGPLPERFQLVDIHILQRLVGHFFHLAEARFEARRRFAQRGFGVDVEVAGIVDDREQQVAELAGALLVALGALDLAQLLVDLAPAARRCRASRSRPARRGAGSSRRASGRGGRGRRRPARSRPDRPPRSAALSASQPGLAAASPKMCGWRRIILAQIDAMTSSSAKAPRSSAMRA